MSSTFKPYPAEQLISEFLKNSDENSMSNLINHCKLYELNENEILLLAKGLAESGEQIRFPVIEKVYDIPSTGGPSSLSTLLSPLFLKALGKNVLKLGVPGRPAGGIDVLAQIKGYQINPNIDEVKKWFSSSGYVHFLAKDNFTPLDAKLFQFRKKNNAIDISSLVIASLLSKKIAAGVQHIGLDIRVSKFGNFGKTIEEASENGIKFNKVAKLAGLESKCFLTNGVSPQQPYIGRGESILALHKIFNNSGDQLLKKHVAQCYRMAYSICKCDYSKGISILSILNAFEENVIVQGGSMDAFREIATIIEGEHKCAIYATTSGIFKIDLEKLRDSIIAIQNKFDDVFPDPAGVILKSSSNDFVTEGDLLCTYRCKGNYWIEFEQSLKEAFTIDNFIYSTDFKEIM